MKKSHLIPTIMIGLATAGAIAADGDDDGKPAARTSPVPPARKSADPAVPFTPDREAEAMAFVRLHHPELASVLEVLKPMDPAEYRKAVVELSQVARSLAEVRARNPRRYEIALDTWKARSRVEMLAAQLAGAPTDERNSQLRAAIEARVDSEIRRHRFDMEQAEAAARKAREAIDRLEANRGAVVEARLRSLQPKKSARPRRGESARPAAEPTRPTTNGEARR